MAVPKTHDLELLMDQLVPSHPGVRSVKRGLLFLADFAVDARYPGTDATKRQAVSGLRWAGRVRDACRAILGIRRPRRRKSR